MLRYCEIYFRPELAEMIIEKVEEKPFHFWKDGTITSPLKAEKKRGAQAKLRRPGTQQATPRKFLSFSLSAQSPWH